MMKKVLILLLCFALLLPLAAQAKTFSYTIPELIGRQLNSGGTSLRVKVSAEAQGEPIDVVGAELWALLQSVLPTAEITGTYFMTKSGGAAGDQQVKGALVQGEETLSAFTLTGLKEKWYLESDLLPGKVYSLSRDMQTAFMNATAPEAGQWPNILRLLSAVEKMDEAYAAQLDEAMSEHMASLNRWLQGYTQVEITAEQQLLQKICVPAADMKQQMKGFLQQIYADEALLVLLRRAVPEADAQAYLESGMLPLLHQVIDQMQLEGEVLISRAYDAQGNFSQEELTLPFAGSMPLRSLTLAHGEKTALQAALQDGSVYGLSFTGGVQAVTGGYEGAYAGEILWQPAGAEGAAEALFTLKMTQGMEQYLEENKSRERDQKLTAECVITPKDGESFPAYKITADVHLTAGASNTKPAYVNTALTWQDMQSGGTLAVQLDMNTSAGLRHSEVDEAQAVQVDTLRAVSRNELLSDLAAQLEAQLTALLSRLIPANDAP